MDVFTKLALLISAWAGAIGTLYFNRKAIKWLVILVLTIWKRTRSRFRGTVLPIPDDALSY